jgi:thioredoxin-like negative regulator of GroEL
MIFTSSLKSFFAFMLAMTVVLTCRPVSAGEISAGVSVAPSELSAPINEQPYFGFLPKTNSMKAADEAFIAGVLKTGVGREAGANRAVQVAWQAIVAGRVDEAARRLNQAWLLQPERSDIAHMFAIVAHQRFQDAPYALRLFSAAASLANPMPTLPADHARMLLVTKQPQLAIPLLELAIQRTPDWAVPKANLAMALYETGQRERACEVLTTVSGREIESVRGDMTFLRNAARC